MLMHCFEGNEATVAMLEVYLPWLRQQGFRATTVSDLFACRGIPPEPGKIYNEV